MKFGCGWFVGGIKDVVIQERSFQAGDLEIYFL
jgi:hypothetical protein